MTISYPESQLIITFIANFPLINQSTLYITNTHIRKHAICKSTLLGTKQSLKVLIAKRRGYGNGLDWLRSRQAFVDQSAQQPTVNTPVSFYTYYSNHSVDRARLCLTKFTNCSA